MSEPRRPSETNDTKTTHGTGYTPENAWGWLINAHSDLATIHDLAEEALDALSKKNYRRVRKYLKEIVDIAYPWTK